MKKDRDLTLPREILEKELSTIKNINLYDCMKDLLLVFQANINISRNIPDLRDGLKPVQRRTLYDLVMELKNRPNSSTIKSNRIVGDTMGKFHPHGDSSVYGALVDMACWWKYQNPLIHPHGNFGSLEGDSAADKRYTEARISEFAYEVYFKEWFDGIVDMHPNYTGTDMEPDYLPAALPMVLLNDILNTSYGNTVSIPTFNLAEVIDLTISAMKDPDNTNYVLIPDTRISCEIMDADWESICKNAKGKYTTVGKMGITEDNNIVIYDIPDGTNIGKIKDELYKMRDEKKIDFKKCENLTDEVKDGKYTDIDVHFTIVLKRGANANEIMKKLEKRGILRVGRSIKFEVVYNWSTYTLPLKRIILDWIDFRRETKRRLIHRNISKSSKDLYLYKTLLDILNKTDPNELFNLFRTSKNKEDVSNKLINRFKISPIQANALAGLKMYEFSKENIGRIKEIISKSSKELNDLEKYMYNDDLLDEIIINELNYFKEKYGRPRRAKIVVDNSIEYAENYNCYVTITQDNHIVKSTDIINCDIKHIIKAKNKDSIILFDEDGNFITTSIHTLKSEPMYISNIANLGNIISVIKLPYGKDINSCLLFLTKEGLIKKTLTSEYNNVKLSTSIKLKENDRIASIIEIEKDKDIIVYTNKGYGLRFNTENVSVSKRLSQGIKAITFVNDIDFIKGVTPLSVGYNYIAMLTKNGKGKSISIKQMSTYKRGDKVEQIIKLSSTDELFGIVATNKSADMIALTNDESFKLTIDDFPELFKNVDGKKILKTTKNNQLLYFNRIK